MTPSYRGGDAVVLDIETVPHQSASDFMDLDAIDAITAPSNYKDEAKIADYIAREKERLTREHLEKAALDPDLCRIVVLGWFDVAADEPILLTCQDEQNEAFALGRFWDALNTGGQVIGFNILNFDLPVLYRRSLYLGVQTPFIQRERYRHARVLDLMDILCEQGRFRFRSVAFYSKRFGIKSDDTIKGKDVPQLVAQGRWDDVVSHCRWDLFTEREIGVRLGLVKPLTVPAESAVA